MLRFAVPFAYAVGGPARTAPEGLVPLDSHSPLRRGMGTAIIAAAPCPARRRSGGQGRGVNTANLLIREYKRSENLIRKFRGYLALGVLLAFVDERATEVLGGVM